MSPDPIVFKITDYIERDLEWEDEECRKLGLRFEHFQLKEAPAAELIHHVGDSDIVLVNMARFTREVIAGLTRAKVIIRHGIGYDNVDVPAATDHGIILANESTASSEDVAEHAVLLMLAAYKKKNIQDRILRDWIDTGVWSSKRIFPLYRLHGKTVGVVGCGNIGSRVVNPFLDYAGLSRLDVVAVSHMDADHINGLPEVLQHVRTEAVYAGQGDRQVGQSQAGRPGSPQGSDLLRQHLDQQGPALRPLAQMPCRGGHSTELALLWPPPDCPIGPAMPGDNDRSAVVLIRFAGRGILLCSDIEQAAQQHLSTLYPDLRADVLVVPHHGSTKTLAPGFVERLDPKVLICSCSPSQIKDGQVLQPRQGQVAFYTGRDGAITVRVEASGAIHVAAYLGPARTLGHCGR